MCAHRRCKVCGFCQGSGFGQKYFGGNAISGSRSGGFSVRFSFLPPRLSPTVHPCAPHATNPASGDHLPIGAWIRACPDTWPRVVVFSRQRPWRAECRLGPLARCSPWPASCRGSAGPHPVIGAGHPFLSLLWRSQAGLLGRSRSSGCRSSQGSAFSHEEPPPLVAATAVKLLGLMITVRRSPIFSYQPVRLGARNLTVRRQSVSVAFHKVTSVAIPLPLPWVFLGDSGQFRGIAWKGLKNRKSPKPLRFRALLLGGPIGIRTRVSALRGPRPRPG